MKQLIILLLFLPLASLAQNNCKKKSKNYQEGEVSGSYFGCLNSKGERHGSGGITYDNSDNYRGEWENDEFISGNAKIKRTLKLTTTGSYYSVEDVTVIMYLEGVFKKTNYVRYIWQLNGANCTQEIYYDNHRSLEKEVEVGCFQDGELFQGTQTQFYKDGRKVTRVVDKGDAVSQKDNFENEYVVEDVDCKLNRNTVDLTRKDLQYVVDLGFGVGDVEFTFDTGAMDLFIGRDAFNKIKKGGGFQELDVDVECSGVFGGGDCRGVIFEEINIGDCAIYNVAATIGLNSEKSLVGIGFFDKFGNVQWDMQKQQLILTRDR